MKLSANIEVENRDFYSNETNAWSKSSFTIKNKNAHFDGRE